MARADQVLPQGLNALRADLGEGSRVAIISLGPGDGAFDARIVEELMDQVEVDSYCGLDFSFELLRQAVHRVSEAVGTNGQFPIRAICGDFTDASTYASSERSSDLVRLFALTGFTLGNYSEQDLVGQIKLMMDEGDYLFLDARLHGFGTDLDRVTDPGSRPESMVSSYDLPSVRRFVFGPAEVATHATADDVEIDFEIVRRRTSVPNALNMLIHCRDLHTTMRLTGQPVRRSRLDLASTTSYNLPDLSSWFEEQGFSTVWQAANGDIAFFLLRRN